MKKTTIISGLLLSTILSAQTLTTSNQPSETIDTGFVLQGGSVLVSDPADTATLDTNNGVHCGDTNTGVHADNSYYRYFDLVGLGEIVVTDIDFGVENAVSGTGGTQPIVIRIHSIPDGSSLPTAVLTLVSEVTTTVADTAAGVVNFPISANLDASIHDLVLEVNTPDGDADGHVLFPGGNTSAQTNETFLSAADCGITEPTATSAINFPDMHTIMVVSGFANTPVELMNFSID